MQKIFLLILIYGTVNAWAAKKNEKENDSEKKLEVQKVYQVGSDAAQLGFDTKAIEKQSVIDSLYFAISRSGINYKIPSLINTTSDFSNKAIGITVGKKQSDLILSIPGFYEYSFEWQNYERDAISTTRYSYSQKLNLFKFNLFQNYSIANAFHKSLFVTFGLGLSPLISTLDQSALSNSETNLGILGTIKTNLTYPLKNKEIAMLNNMALDLELSAGIGTLGGENLNMTAIKFGSNFNW